MKGTELQPSMEPSDYPDTLGLQTSLQTRLTAPTILKRINAICFGAAAGGPDALCTIFREIPPTLDVPVLISQQMPPFLIRSLAERLDSLSALTVFEAEDGQYLDPGCAYLAPSGSHMTVSQRNDIPSIHLNQFPPVNRCRPSIDLLFQSMVDIYTGNLLGIILTGTGRDGLIGCNLIRNSGGYIIVQDQSTSDSWEMPGSIAEVGLANRVLPLDQIASEAARITRLSRDSKRKSL